jgi:hypothetical protein
MSTPSNQHCYLVGHGTFHSCLLVPIGHLPLLVSFCLISNSLMGKTRHSKTSPLIRHVRYITKTSTRGPKVVKQQVKQRTFQASPSKSRIGSRTHQEAFYDDNDHSHPEEDNIRGKVLCELLMYWKQANLILNCRVKTTIFEISSRRG